MDQLTSHFLIKPNINSDNHKIKKEIVLWSQVARGLVFFALFLLPVLSAAQGKVIHVKDPGDGNDIGSNIKSAWDNASDGDTILLPQGNFTIDGTVKLGYPDNMINNACIKGRGSGKNGTKLYRDYVPQDNEYLLKFSIGDNYNYEVEISDIWFQGPPPRTPENPDGADSRDIDGLSFTKYNVYLHHCKFQYFTGVTVRVQHEENNANSVISENTFVENRFYENGDHWFGSEVIIVTGPDHTWPDVTPGTDDFIFIEDNYFGEMNDAVDAAYGARYVFRYNEISSSTNLVTQMHPAQPDWVYSNGAYGVATRFTEVYKNTIESSDNSGIGIMEAYGGESVIWGNTVYGARYGVAMNFPYNWSDECSDHPNQPSDWTTPDYPIPYQIGYESGKQYGTDHTGTGPSAYGKGDIFIWDNEFIDSVSDFKFIHFGYADGRCSEFEGYLQEGRDYHLSKRPGYEPYTYPHPRRDTAKTVFLSTDPQEGGSIDGSKNSKGGSIDYELNYETGKEATLHASPAEGFAFDCWTSGSDTLSADATYTFEVMEDISITANFVEQCDVAVIAEPSEGGDIIIGGNLKNTDLKSTLTFKAGTEAALQASPAEGFAFDCWISGDDTLSVDASFSFTVKQDTTITGCFRKATATGIDNINRNRNIRFFPNPVRHRLHIRGLTPGNYMLFIYTINGKMVLERQIKGHLATFNLEGLDGGVYLVKILGDGTSYSQKIIVI